MSKGAILSQPIVARGLSLYYDFANYKCYTEESSDINDLTDYDNDTEIGSPTPTFTKKPGYAYFTFGSTSVIKGTLPYSFDPDNNITISFWLKGNNTTQPQHLVQFQTSAYGVDATGFVVNLDRGNSNQLNFSLTNSGGSIISNYLLGVPHTSICNNKWNNVVLSINNKSITPYLNAISYTPVSYAPNSVSGTCKFMILGGNGESGVPYPFYGDMANFSAHGRALSSTEILQNYNALKNKFTEVI